MPADNVFKKFACDTGKGYRSVIYLFNQHLFSALFTNKHALMRYLHYN